MEKVMAALCLAAIGSMLVYWLAAGAVECWRRHRGAGVGRLGGRADAQAADPLRTEALGSGAE